MSQMVSDVQVLERAAARFGDLSQAIGDHQWVLPTPCTEWNVEQLVDHVLGGNWYTIEVLSGSTSDVAIAAAVAAFTDNIDRPTAFAESSAAQQERFETSGALVDQFDHVVGLTSGRIILRLRIHELIIHGWDLATALDLPTGIGASFLDWAHTELSSDESVGQHFGIDSFATADTDRQAHLLSAFGRSEATLRR